MFLPHSLPVPPVFIYVLGKLKIDTSVIVTVMLYIVFYVFFLFYSNLLLSIPAGARKVEILWLEIIYDFQSQDWNTIPTGGL